MDDFVVHSDGSLAAFVKHLIQNHAPPSTLIVCSPKQEFVHQLLDSVPRTDDDDAHFASLQDE
jgi:hypothetical protein